jgi:hypothetical protein
MCSNPQFAPMGCGAGIVLGFRKMPGLPAILGLLWSPKKTCARKLERELPHRAPAWHSAYAQGTLEDSIKAAQP